MSSSSAMTDVPSTATSTGPMTRLQGNGKQSVIDIVMSEHRLVEKLHEEFKTSSDVQHKQKLIHLIIKELSQHAAKEEMVMYPAMKKYLPNGDQLVNHALMEHQQVKQELYQIDNMKLGVDANLPALLEKCLADVMHHVQEEETDLLPSLGRAIPREQLLELGQQYLAAEARAPTRPHPDAPNQGLMAEAANISAKALDALKDTSRDLDMKEMGMSEVQPKASGDSAIQGAKTVVSEPNPSIRSTIS